MTIRRGEPWGEAGALERSAVILDSDAELSQTLARSLGDNLDSISDESFEFGLVGGDLHRTLGSPRHSSRDLYEGHGMRFDIDLGIVSLNTDEGPSDIPFVAHLVATSDRGGHLWHGRSIVVMNAAFRGSANLGPRAHPNDGRLDVTDGVLGAIDRYRARARWDAGAHVPHPRLAESRVRKLSIENPSKLFLWVDDQLVATTDRFDVRCVPDAITIVV